MSNVVLFRPKERSRARVNLSKFIRLCRDELTVFNTDDYEINWGDYYWPKAANFTKLGTHARGHTEEDALDAPYIDFAKAYFRHQQGVKRTCTRSEQKAVVILERAFIELDRKPCIIELTEEVLDQAAELARSHYAKGAAYQAGRELAVLAKFVSEKNITATPIDWSNPISRANDKNKTGRQAKKEREEKLPDVYAVNALAELFNSHLTIDADVFVTSYFAMLLCAPQRGSETLDLTVDCDDIAEEFLTYKDENNVTNTGYGWRYCAGKGYDPEIKWIPTAMQALAKDAKERIVAITQQARNFAKIMEELLSSDQKEFPRHANCPDVYRDKPLDVVQVAQALGWNDECINTLKSPNGKRATVRGHSRNFVKNRGLSNRDYVYTLNDLIEPLLNRLPKGFPWVNEERGVKYSNALCCMFRHQMDTKRGTVRAELWIPSVNVLNTHLGSTKAVTDDNKSIFERYGYNEGRDETLSITTHQVRHWLNTIAQRGGLSQEQIAKWSGRADQSQNEVYNHVLPQERRERYREIDSELTVFGPSDIVVREPVSITEFNTLERVPAHVTEFGFCEHDYSMSPCLHFRDCVICDEEVCVKGDMESLERMKSAHVHLEVVVARDQIAIESGNLDKEDQSYLHNLMSLMRLAQKIQLMESPELMDGAEIRLQNQFRVSHYELGLAKRKENGRLGSSKTKHEVKALKNQKKKTARLKELMEGGLG